MNVKLTYDFFKKFDTDTYSFIYQGHFRDKVTSAVINLIESNIESLTTFSRLRNKVSFLIIESFQNIIRHTDCLIVDKETNKSEFFITRNIGNIFYITSANFIENDKISILEEKLKNINKLEKKELKKLYLSILTNRKLSNKGGAGLGLIEMARKTGEKLDYDFIKVNNELSLFYFQLKLRDSKKNEDQPEASFLKIQDAEKIHDYINQNQILVVHKGIFSQEAIKPVLRMVENNLQNNILKTQKIAYHMMVEILQNISQHSYGKNGIKEGILMLGKEKGTYIINAGNYILKKDKPQLKKHLDHLNSMTKKELNEKYIKILAEGIDDKEAGLGLIDIAREVNERIEYSFHKVDNNILFFAISIRFK